MKLTSLMRRAVICVLANYLCILAIWGFGIATRWDGQGAILVLPIILLAWTLAAASLVLLGFAAVENIWNGLAIALMCLPVWIAIYIFLWGVI